MNIIERGRQFVQELRELAGKSDQEWRRCPYCGVTGAIKNGSYRRQLWTFAGRIEKKIQRYKCSPCGKTYSEGSCLWARGSWYAREVHRCAVEHWTNGRMSLRGAAEYVRSWVGKQERWLKWRPLDEGPREEEKCRLSASTVHRWLDGAGEEAERTVVGQLEGIECSGQMGTDGLWARLRGGGKRVVLALVDSVSGVIWPPVVAKGEESRASWRGLFDQAKRAGLDLEKVDGITSDGAKGLLSYLQAALRGVHQQRCIWHLWRNLGGKIAQGVKEATKGLKRQEGQGLRKELRGLVRAILDAPSYEAGKEALANLARHSVGTALAQFLNPLLDAALMHLMACHQGLLRVSPEWCWRDYRMRLSRGRNHGSHQRLERASLVWAIHRNFTPAQRRSERKRHYRHPGKSPLEVAGASPGPISYLDALRI